MMDNNFGSLHSFIIDIPRQQRHLNSNKTTQLSPIPSFHTPKPYSKIRLRQNLSEPKNTKSLNKNLKYFNSEYTKKTHNLSIESEIRHSFM